MHTPDSRTPEDIPSGLFEQLAKLDAAISALDAQRQMLGELYAARGDTQAAQEQFVQAAAQFNASGLADALAHVQRRIAAV